MSPAQQVIDNVIRQALSTAALTTTSSPKVTPSPPACSGDNDYDGRMGVRISAIFVIMIGSLFGAAFPVYAARHRGVGVPEWAFFIAKYFGSGVIIATAFIHLLAPANEALMNPCLTGPITAYSWPEGIALMTIFVLFFIELMAMRYATFGHNHSSSDEEISPNSSTNPILSKSAPTTDTLPPRTSHHTPGEDHLSHTRTHIDRDESTKTIPSSTDSLPSSTDSLPSSTPQPPHDIEDYAAQMTAIFILEFGIIFHSIFVGLTLAVAGQKEFTTLYVVLVFHQTFEGLGLGSRLAVAPWPASSSSSSKETRKRRCCWTPYFFAAGFALSTPVAMAIGLGVRETYRPGSQLALVVNGVFDSVSGGILIYTGLVELMAHEFMFSHVMRRARLPVVLSAFGMMCLGAGLMALLGKWA